MSKHFLTITNIKSMSSVIKDIHRDASVAQIVSESIKELHVFSESFSTKLQIIPTNESVIERTSKPFVKY